MPRSVQEIDLVILIIELHHRRGDADAPLLLNGEKVAGGFSCGFSGFDGSCLLDGAAEQKQFFREGGLARVRMADYCKGPAFGYLFQGASVRGLGGHIWILFLLF